MSRIVHGPSQEIRAIRPAQPSKGVSQARLPVFHSMNIEGSLSEEEIETRLAAARAEGYREAEQRLGQPLRQSLENVERILDELSRFRRELFKESENDVLDLVTHLAKKVVLKELSLSPEIMKSIVEKALGHLEKQKRLSLQVNSVDFDFYQRAKPDFLSKLKGLSELSIEVDSQIEPGSAVVKSQSLEIDLSLDAMVDQIMSQIQAARVEVSKTNDEEDLV